MKKHILLIAAMFFTLLTYAQLVTPPAAVLNSFKKLYPTSNPSWEMEHGNYEAEFRVEGYEHTVLLNEKGEVLEIEQDIPLSGLPATAKAYLEKNYPGQRVKDTQKRTDSKGRVTYKAEVDGRDDVDFVFDATGAVLVESR